ncbi:AbrB family transcriptional regulator [Paracoccus cavernae]
MTAAQMRTFAAGAAGAAGFLLLGLPLPLLLGPLFACLAVGLAGGRMGPVGLIGTVMRTILGVAVGASITPDLIARLPDMVLSAALVPVFILVIGLVGYPFFRRICGFDGPTAFYCAMPGGFQDMVVFGEEAGADIRALSLVHATRILVIVTVLPFLISQFYGRSLDGSLGASVAEIPVPELLLMVVAAIGGWQIAKRLRLFGASIIGPMVFTAALSLAGLITHRPPALAIMAAQFFIGCSVGAKYSGVTARELKVDVLAGVAFCLILAVISLVFAELVILLGLAPDVEALLSFAPGGQGEMAVLALIVGADLPFVVTHHLVRIVTVILGAPIIARWLDWGRPPRAPDASPASETERKAQP